MILKVSRLPLGVFVLALALLTGCIFSPERKPAKPIDKPPALLPTSPVDVLQNLVNAYNSRDSVLTAAVYDSSYVGTTTDPSQPDPIPSFTRNDEIRHVGRLKLDPNIVSVFLDLGQATTWQVLDGSASDPPSWKVIQITSQTVRVEDIARATTWLSENQVIEYTFKPKAVPGAPPSQDTTWTVVRWTEIAN